MWPLKPRYCIAHLNMLASRIILLLRLVTDVRTRAVEAAGWGKWNRCVGSTTQRPVPGVALYGEKNRKGHGGWLRNG